ncbi:hypothetical protein ADL22_12435 [Streptomyces sp. NRRL F-4489]|uniref:hypothetical protein n=1 Tax=Streptomyces sp. NRRL F-4489 TaxID=1609095 RepID=UPI00074ABC54|nr:hypothetical protein [Streptomyces sp. NRRL F-4489]KUL44745.1 hypothetical protein ADL22_12435 [Streptomyces sp. NRRL F-4489]
MSMRCLLATAVESYLAAHPHEGDRLSVLVEALESHRHADGGDAACEQCPIIVVSAVVVNEFQAVLHFWDVGIRDWVMHQEFVAMAECDAEDLLSLTYSSLVGSTGLDQVWVAPKDRCPLLIDVSRVRANPEKCLPAQVVYTVHFLFRTLSSQVPIGIPAVRRWTPLLSLDNLLRARVHRALSLVPR